MYEYIWRLFVEISHVIFLIFSVFCNGHIGHVLGPVRHNINCLMNKYDYLIVCNVVVAKCCRNWSYNWPISKIPPKSKFSASLHNGRFYTSFIIAAQLALTRLTPSSFSTVATVLIFRRFHAATRCHVSNKTAADSPLETLGRLRQMLSPQSQ